MRNKRWIAMLLLLCMALTLLPVGAGAEEIETVPMYRLYNPNSGEHLYTGSVEERENLVTAGWNYEGVAWNAPVSSGTPVHRVYNPNSGDHHYTMSQEEVDMLVALGWQYENVAWNSVGTVPQYRLYNPNADCGSHHYTSSEEERDYLVSLGWQYEGIGWYGIAGSADSDEPDAPATEPTTPDESTKEEVTEEALTTHTHTYVVSYVHEPCCCRDPGYTIKACACGDTVITNTTQALPHSYTATVVAPTAYSQGYTLYECHEYCESNYAFCYMCYTDDYVDKLPAESDTSGCEHSFAGVTMPGATCYSEGIMTYICDKCDFSYTEVLPKTEHEWYLQELVADEATCIYDGSEGYMCRNCRDYKPDDVIPALGHDYTTVIVAPTADAMGYTEFTCTRCDVSFRDNYTEMVEDGSIGLHTHIPTVEVTAEANCGTAGVKTYICACGDSYTEAIPATGDHTWGEWITNERTCTMNGFKKRTCSTCGAEDTTDVYFADGHSWGSWVTTKEPTTSEEGTAVRTCSECGTEDTKVLDKKTGDAEEEEPGEHSHSYGEWTEVLATCTEDGYRYRSCSCGETEQEDTGKTALGHYTFATAEKNGKLEYTCFRCGNRYVEDTEYRYDEGLTPPEVESVSLDDSYASISCYASFENGSGYGYQGYISRNQDFSGAIRECKSNSRWNGMDYVQLSFFNYNFNPGTYYYKVRTYRMDGDTFVYGPWSEVMTVDRPNFRTKLEKAPQYSYDIYFIDNLGTDVFTSTDKALYVKTDNPDVNTFRLVSGNTQIFMNYSACADVEFEKIGDHNEWLRKVPGGYLGMLNVMDAGNLTIEVQEASAEGYVVAKTFQVNVLDYETERNKWIDNVIATQTDNSMNPKEKMDAVAEYLRKGEFRYLTNSDGKLVSLAAQPCSPWFVSKRWDSCTSPAMLAVFAERIGGFEEVHNCYPDYPRGSAEWYEYHASTYVVYGGETYYYTVCPGSNTGDVGTVQKIDFGNTAQFTQIA